MTEEFKVNNPIDTDPDPSPNPGATKLRRYWTKGKGAAKIRWGVSGDFNRCVRHLGKYVTDPKGLCNVYHVAAVGAPPGQGHPGGKSLEDGETKEVEINLDQNMVDEIRLISGMLAEDPFAFMDMVEEKGGHDLIFYSNRSTPQVVSTGAAAKPKNGYGKVTRRRKATAKEEAAIARGDWVRVDQSGNTPKDDKYKRTKYRPQLVKKDLPTEERIKQLADILINVKYLDILDDNETERKNHMSDMEFKNAASGHLISDDEKTGIVEAFVSVTGIKDHVDDIIMPGAYEKTLQNRTPKGVWSHDWNTPISKALDVKEMMPGDDGLPKTLPNGDPWPAEAGALYVKMQFNMDTQRGREAYSDVSFYGDSAEWSIGYNVPKGEAKVDPETGIRHIKNLNLFEYSPVLFGAASQARTKKDALETVKEMFTTDGEFLAEVKSLLGDINVTEVTPGHNHGPEVKCADHDCEFEEAELEDEEGTKAVASETPNAVVVGEVPEEGDDDPEKEANQQATVEEVVEDLTALEASAQREGLPGQVVEGLKKIQTLLSDIINAAVVPGPGNALSGAPAAPVAQKAEPKPDETADAGSTDMRKVMDDLIYNTNYDVDRLDTIDNGVRALQKSIAENNGESVASQAEAVLQEIGYAAQSTPDQNFINALEKLSVTIGKALQAYAQSSGQTTQVAPTEATADTSATSTVTPSAEPARKSISMEEWKDLLN